MSKQIEKIIIGMENCESYHIPVECVRYMSVCGFEENIQMSYGRYSDYRRAYSFYIKIKNDSKIKPIYNFSENFNERIQKYDDVCVITLCYQNGEEFTFYVPWDYSNEFHNSYQKVKLDKNKNIIITITKTI